MVSSSRHIWTTLSLHHIWTTPSLRHIWFLRHVTYGRAILYYLSIVWRWMRGRRVRLCVRVWEADSKSSTEDVVRRVTFEWPSTVIKRSTSQRNVVSVIATSGSDGYSIVDGYSVVDGCSVCGWWIQSGWMATLWRITTLLLIPIRREWLLRDYWLVLLVLLLFSLSFTHNYSASSIDDWSLDSGT